MKTTELEELFYKVSKQHNRKKRKRREDRNNSIIDHFKEYTGLDMTGKLGFVIR